MKHTPNPDPDLGAVPGGRLLAGLSLAALAVLVAHLLTVPGVLATLAVLAAIAALPVLLMAGAVRARPLLPRAVEWARRKEIPEPGIVPERPSPEEAD